MVIIHTPVRVARCNEHAVCDYGAPSGSLANIKGLYIKSWSFLCCNPQVRVDIMKNHALILELGKAVLKLLHYYEHAYSLRTHDKQQDCKVQSREDQLYSDRCHLNQGV